LWADSHKKKKPWYHDIKWFIKDKEYLLGISKVDMDFEKDDNEALPGWGNFV
jgi:hypothetical protein